MQLSLSRSDSLEFDSWCAERVFPGRLVSRHGGLLGAGTDYFCLAVWIQRPTQKDEPQAERHDTRYRHKHGHVHNMAEIMLLNPGLIVCVLSTYFSE